MYYTNINDAELNLLHRLTKVNVSYDEIKDENIFLNDEEHKLIPLFYFNKITDVDKVKVLDNQCILYSNLSDVGVYFESDELIYFNVVYSFKDGALKLHFFDNESLFNLNNFEVNIVNNTIGLNQNFITDKYGNLIIELNNSNGEFECIANNQKRVFSLEND